MVEIHAAAAAAFAVSALDIVSYGRLGTVVKKAPLLCTVSDGAVDFVSLEWTGAN